MTEMHHKPTKYYIDFENVHGAGLKGVDDLDEQDEVIIIYSQAAETFHIEHAIDILKSKARIEFIEVDGGTRNAADFQLIVALFGAMDEAFDYVIVSGDTGFDAAIKMGERMDLPHVSRFANIRGDIEIEKTEKPKSRRSRRSRSGRETAVEVEQQSLEPQTESASNPSETLEQAQPNQQAEIPSVSAPATPENNAEPQTENQTEGQPTPSKRRTRRRRRSSGSQDALAVAEPEAASQADDDANTSAASIDTAAAEVLEEASEPSVDASTEAPSAEKPAKSKKAPATPRKKASTKAHEEARQDTAAARARAAEAMKLALAEPAKKAEIAATQEVAPEADAMKPEPVAAFESQDETTVVKALLEEKGVQLSDAQIATVAKALNGSNGRQDFYRRILKIERQQKGRALYRQVREHYQALKDALQALA